MGVSRAKLKNKKKKKETGQPKSKCRAYFILHVEFRTCRHVRTPSPIKRRRPSQPALSLLLPRLALPQNRAPENRSPTLLPGILTGDDPDHGRRGLHCVEMGNVNGRDQQKDGGGKANPAAGEGGPLHSVIVDSRAPAPPIQLPYQVTRTDQLIAFIPALFLRD